MRVHLRHLLAALALALAAVTALADDDTDTPVWAQASTDTDVSVKVLATKALSVRNFSRSRKSGVNTVFPYVMFNDGMGDVSRGFREYAKIDKKLARRKPQAVSLAYELTFSPGFEWSAKGRLGGLLPGLTGGKGKTSWRVQLAWDPDGRVTVSKNLANQNRGGGKRPIETPEGAYWKPSPETNMVRLTVQQNRKRTRDGRLSVEVNGKRIALLSDVVYDWKGKGKSKYVLREGRYLGPNPTRGSAEIRYLTTRNLRVSEVDMSLDKPDDFWGGSELDDDATVVPTLPPPTTPAVVKPPTTPAVVKPPTTPGVTPTPTTPTTPTAPTDNNKLVTLNWTQGALSTDAVAPRRFDPATNELYLCSGDVLQFSWSGEPGRGIGVYGFFSVEDWQSCTKTPDTELNYMKNQRPSGLFKTKPNRGGWRWYASFDGADDGHCKYSCNDGKGISGGCNAKVAVNWDMQC